MRRPTTFSFYSWLSRSTFTRHPLDSSSRKLLRTLFYILLPDTLVWGSDKFVREDRPRVRLKGSSAEKFPSIQLLKRTWNWSSSLLVTSEVLAEKYLKNVMRGLISWCEDTNNGYIFVSDFGIWRIGNIHIQILLVHIFFSDENLAKPSSVYTG